MDSRGDDDGFCLQPELCLGYLELSVALEFDQANAKVGSSEVNGQVRTSLLPGRPSEHVGWKHGLQSIMRH